LWLGVSVHGAREAVEAARDGANFLILGTIHPTPSHPGRDGAGPELIRATRDELDAGGFDRVGIVAIGGIDAANMVETFAAGAAGVAVQRAVWEATDPAAAAGRLVAQAERQGQGAS
jgi:thiamine-phosphate pyrophosphorylase